MKHFLLIAALVSSGCGYHMAGTTDTLPTEIHTIVIPAWTSMGVQYKLPDLMAEAVTREIISRTRYKVVVDPTKADAVLTGALANMFSSASIGDPVTGRTTGGQIVVHFQVRLLDKSGKVLFNQPNLEFRERYELSFNPSQYFDESSPAMQRLANDAAKSIVSAILENF